MRASTSAGATWGPLAPNISAGRAMYPTAVWEPSTERVIVQFNNWPGAHGCLHLPLFWLAAACAHTDAAGDAHYYSPVPHQISSSDGGASASTIALHFLL